MKIETLGKCLVTFVVFLGILGVFLSYQNDKATHPIGHRADIAKTIDSTVDWEIKDEIEKRCTAICAGKEYYFACHDDWCSCKCMKWYLAPKINMD